MDLEKKYKNITLEEFLDIISDNNLYWIAKRLSGNDTGVTGGHQVGLYYPRTFFNKCFNEICTVQFKNPDSYIKQVYFPENDSTSINVRAIYYNNKFTENKTRNEFRLTSWGGSNSPVQNIENTGAIFLFTVFKHECENYALGWVASNAIQEDLIEDWIGTEVFPGEFRDRDNINYNESSHQNKIFKLIPEEWYKEFPSGYDIFSLIEGYTPWDKCKGNIDKLLVDRRNYEFSLFKHLEWNFVMPILKNGFTTVDEFIFQANSITNRRKSRTGKSLEHNLTSIFKSEGLEFGTQCITEQKKKPDFLFPSEKRYHDPDFPFGKLNMLGAKTCCKDRWRQILSEAKRIDTKHLFTLQEGTSSQQLKEMEASKVKLVIPKSNINCFPKDWRNELMTLREFVDFRKKLDINKN